MANITVIYPGTFDPITKGHLEIIKRAIKIFPRIIIGVAENTPKATLFSLSQRLEMVQNDIDSLKNDTCIIEVKQFSGLLADFAKIEKVWVIIRGLRAVSDFEYEFQMAFMNHKISSELETLFIPANENGHFISSGVVKEMARLGGNIEGFVSHEVAKKLYAHFNAL